MTDAERIRLYRELTGREPTLRPNGKETMQQLHGVTPGRTCRECSTWRRFSTVKNITNARCGRYTCAHGKGYTVSRFWNITTPAAS